MAKRIVYFYDLKIEARGISRAEGNEADFSTDPKSLKDIVSHVEKIFQGGGNLIQRGHSEDSESYYIQDLSVNEKYAVILLNRSDPKAPNAVSSDPNNKERLIHEKPPKHGGEYSAHLVIFLEPVRGDNHYLCLFEAQYGSGLSATTIRSFLAHMIRFCKKEFPKEYKVPNINGAKSARGNPKLVDVRHFIEFHGHPSDKFINELETGKLTSIQLISYTDVGAKWDDRGFVKERKRTVDLVPSADLIGDTMSAIRAVRNKVTKDYKEYGYLRVAFKNGSGELKDATISADSGELCDSDKFVKKHTLSLPLIKTNSFDVVQGLIVNRMLDHLG